MTSHRGKSHALGFSLVLLGCLPVIIGPLAGPVGAHATLTSTAPIADQLLERGPEAIEISFDEPVQVIEGGVQVIDPEGQRADRGSVDQMEDGARLLVSIEAELQGTYTVAWRVLSEDGHNLSGSFLFHVGIRTGVAEIGNADSTMVDVSGAVGRWTGFAGLLGVGGAVVMMLLTPPSDGALRARAARLAVLSGLGGAVGAVLVLVAHTAEATGRGLTGALGLAPDLAVDTRTGVLIAAKGGCLLAAAAIAGIKPVWRRAPWLAGVAALAAGVLSSFAGHAWTADRRMAAVATDAVHLLAVVIWIGGLVGLLVCLSVAVDRVRLAKRFSLIALVTAGLVAVTGTVSGAIQLGSLEALTSTSYGQLVLAKVAGFVTLLWFGWINRRSFLPIVERTATPLLRSMRGEVLVAIVVLAITAVLVDTPPGRNQLAQPFSTSAAADDGSVQVTVDPARPGENDIHLYFYDPAGRAPLPVDAVEVTVATGEIPPRRVRITPVTASHVTAFDVILASPGSWILEVTAVRAGIPSTYTIEVPIR